MISLSGNVMEKSKDDKKDVEYLGVKLKVTNNELHSAEFQQI